MKTHQQPPVAPDEYRAAFRDLKLFREGAEEAFKAAHGANNTAEAKEILEELQHRLNIYKELRLGISERDRFLVEFDVSTMEPQRVSVTIPRGVSRVEVIERADQVVVDTFNRKGVFSPVLNSWKKEREFCAPLLEEETFIIEGRISGTEGKGLWEQQQVIESLGYEMVTRADLAVAHVAYLAATGDNIFGWSEPRQSYYVRTYDRTFEFQGYGLSDIVVGAWRIDNIRGMAGRVRTAS